MGETTLILQPHICTELITDFAMKLKIGNSALILEESPEQYRLVVDVEKLRGRAKTVLLMLLAAGCIALFAMKWFIIASALAFALAIYKATDYIKNELVYDMDFDLPEGMPSEIMHELSEIER